MPYHWEDQRQTSNPKRRARLAETYRPDERMDKLSVAIQADPTLREKLTSSLRMQLGYYESAKAAFEQEQAAKR